MDAARLWQATDGDVRRGRATARKTSDVSGLLPCRKA